MGTVGRNDDDVPIIIVSYRLFHLQKKKRIGAEDEMANKKRHPASL